MKCIVVDDERIAREGLNEFIKEFDYLENVGLFSNAQLALQKIQSQKVDLIFLDIQMPLLNGLDFAKFLADKPSMIIFTTAHAEYALQGYQVNSVGYLLKPIFWEDFKLAVQKAKKRYDQINSQVANYEPIFIRESGNLVKIHPTELMYVRGLQNYIELNLENGKRLLIHQTLKSMIEMLPDDLFIQIHKSYVVNKGFISRFEGTMLFLGENGLPVSRDRKKRILEILR